MNTARDWERTGFGITGIASVFIRRLMVDSALVYLRRNDRPDLSRDSEVYAETQGLLGMVHLLQGDTLSALPVLRSSIAISGQQEGYFVQEVRFSIVLSKTLLSASSALLRRAGSNHANADAEAAVLAQRALELSRRLHALQEERDALLMLSTVSERRGDLSAALEYHKQYTAMKASVLEIQ
ncbi:MAG: hypothetical protein IPM46_00485 [Flavobacteriales bacterium]|nr:hypothetical protein [Flavobacteriales bacterium]